ncbi:MAG: pilus assembly protein PilP [Nitrospirota bacterium]
MNRILICFLMAVCVLSSSCGKGQPPPRKPSADKQAQPAATPEEKVAQEASKSGQEEVAYDARGRRDPFLPLVQVTKEKPKKKMGASPMESYGVEEIRLLAIAWDNDKYYALIMLPDKKTYTITEGMTLGLQDGKVEKITKDSVHIREYVKDYKGDIKPRDSILKLHKGEE